MKLDESLVFEIILGTNRRFKGPLYIDGARAAH